MLLGYGVDGEFGEKTKDVLINFQKDKDLNVDGKYGEKSHIALMDALSDEEVGNEDNEGDMPAEPEEPKPLSGKGEPMKLDTQKSLNEAFNRRSVRLDVYIGDGKSVYNLEMQTTQHAGLAKRTWLYQAHMDINQLQRGQFYTRLRDLHLHLWPI